MATQCKEDLHRGDAETAAVAPTASTFSSQLAASLSLSESCLWPYTNMKPDETRDMTCRGAGLVSHVKDDSKHIFPYV